MTRRPTLTTARAAEIYLEALTCRRIFCEDHEFFKASELWEDLCCESESWKINTYRRNKKESYKLKAGVVVFGELDLVKLTVDEELWAKAQRGQWMENFVLAHELGHIALGHHDKGAVTKNFQVFPTPLGMANIPPTKEEEEANYFAVFLQCGVALENTRWAPVELARRAFSDPSYVKKSASGSQARCLSARTEPTEIKISKGHPLMSGQFEIGNFSLIINGTCMKCNTYGWTSGCS